MRRLLLGLAVVLLVLATVVAIAVLVVLHRVEGDYLAADGVRLHYTVEGEGKPVVLLHGFAVNSDLNWRLPGITEALAEHFQVIALDLRGHGLSDKPHEASRYGMEMGRDVLRLLDHLGIAKAHVVGYSLGGFIALRLAATHPERLISATLMGSGWERPENPEFRIWLNRLRDNLISGEAIGPLSRHLGTDRPAPGLIHTWFVKLMTGYWNDKLALAAMIGGLSGLSLSEEELRNIAVPLCAIVGSDDPLKVSAESLAATAREVEFLVVEDADHIQTPMRSETLDGLKSFLIQHSGVVEERSNAPSVLHPTRVKSSLTTHPSGPKRASGSRKRVTTFSRMREMSLS